jgi:hypothetical protein
MLNNLLKQNFYLNKFITYGLYFFAFILPIQTRWIIKAGKLNSGYWEYGTISLYITDVLLLLLLFIFIVLSARKRTDAYQITVIWWIVASLEMAVFISVWIAMNKELAIYAYGRFLLALGLFWLLNNASYNRLKLIYAFLAGILSQATLGLWQFFTQTAMANKWLGMAAHSSAQLGVLVVETLSGERWLRAYGGLDHPNMLGALLVVGILFIIDLFLKEKYSLGKFFLFYFLFFVFLSALFFTFSRGAWAGLLIGLLVMLIITLIRRNLDRQKKILKIILAGSLLIFILFHFYSNLVLTRLSTDTRLEAKSNTERIASYHAAGKIIKHHWLLGVGVGNYTLAVYNELNGRQPSWYYQPVHNAYLLVWAETGLLGIFSFLVLLITFVYCWFTPHFKAFNNQKTEFSQKSNLIATGILTALAVMMLVDHFFWSLHFGLLLFWFVFGVLSKNET